MNLADISVTVLAKNSEQHLQQVLQALEPFGEVIVYDTGSTDKTIEIARAFPHVKVVNAPFIGFGATHNAATDTAKYDWILSIDSDEIVTPELVQAVAQADLNADTVYAFPRHNYFNGKFIRWCGWYPDRQMRLYNRKKTCFSNAQVHEAIIADMMNVVALDGAIVHYSYGSIADFLTKMQSYSTLFANQYQGKRRSSFGHAIAHGIFAFIKSYIIKRGFLGGYEGAVISLYNGHTAYYKYLKLHEANQKLRRKMKGLG